MPKQQICIFWFRRDLRLFDNHGLFKALSSDFPVLPIFIFDTNILSDLSNPKDKRVLFIWQELERIKQQLEDLGSTLQVFYDTPENVFKQLLLDYDLKLLVANRDYEPYALERDKEIYDLLAQSEVKFSAFKDQVLFDRSDIVKGDGKPYLVYTPYSKAYKAKLTEANLEAFPTEKYWDNFLKMKPKEMIPLEKMGFASSDFEFPSRSFNEETIANYHLHRDFPAQKEGTTRLSVHLRFGTISIRQLAKHAKELNVKYFNELIWRDFYQMILYFFPHTVTRAFRPEYDAIQWENNEADFERWKSGTTGYELVDAGMRELNATGFMHNRVRMLVASFLTKHLLIDWKWGEAYFAEKLLDFDQASNVGGWQWAAGSGVDAAPYFRVFNPHLQLDKFDKNREYVRRWVPEFEKASYPKPMVDHKSARLRALERYKDALKS